MLSHTSRSIQYSFFVAYSLKTHHCAVLRVSYLKVGFVEIVFHSLGAFFMCLWTGALKRPTEWAGQCRQIWSSGAGSIGSLGPMRMLATLTAIGRVQAAAAAAANERKALLVTVQKTSNYRSLFNENLAFAFSIADYNSEPSGVGALASSFDKSVLHISDWLTWEQNMIKIQSVLVNDGDAVRQAIEKQEVSSTESRWQTPFRLPLTLPAFRFVESFA